jgi:hypothetical protein
MGNGVRMGRDFYQILHLSSIFVLVGTAIWAIANPVAGERKKALMISGIASLLALVGAFGLLHTTGLGFPMWAVVKLFVWLMLSALVGIAYRKPEKRKALLFVLIALVATALTMVAYKPFE